ncbi:MAG: sulfur carrier protein ThiS [Acidiphilium sp.]|nr:sulfur carrier protein ThiS [Acidiphilium sp.]MDD4935805.1 sulfur carrier protein ThiS [Acidiphilium sp.]
MSDACIRVNGVVEVGAATIAELLAARGLSLSKGLAVALNEQVVPRSAWGATRLRDGDTIEIVRAVGGG